MCMFTINATRASSLKILCPDTLLTADDSYLQPCDYMNVYCPNNSISGHHHHVALSVIIINVEVQQYLTNNHKILTLIATAIIL